jgi:hypothetical protein
MLRHERDLRSDLVLYAVMNPDWSIAQLCEEFIQRGFAPTTHRLHPPIVRSQGVGALTDPPQKCSLPVIIVVPLNEREEHRE